MPTDALAVLPDDSSPVQGAALPLAGLTALRLLRAAGSVLGRRVLLTGASGGVGHFVDRARRRRGAEVTAVTRDAERGPGFAELGAAEIVHDLADARGPYDVVLESTGGQALPLALARLAEARHARSGSGRPAGRRQRSTSSTSSPDRSRPSFATSTTSTPTPGSAPTSRRSSG